MLRRWILVLMLALLTGSANGSLTFWLNILGPTITAPFQYGMDRLSNRLDRVQAGIANRVESVTNQLTNTVAGRLGAVGDRVTDRLADGVSNRLDVLTDRVTNSMGGGLTEQLSDRVGDFFSGFRNNDNNRNPPFVDTPFQSPPRTRRPNTSTQRPRNNTNSPRNDVNVSDVVSGVTDAVNSRLGDFFG